MPRGSGLNLSTCMGDCAFSEVDRCVLASTCSVDVTNNAVGEAVFLEDGVSLEFGVTPKEERRTVSQDLELWMSKEQMTDGYNLIARAGRVVQEIHVRTTMDASAMKQTVQRVLGKVA